MLFWKDGLFVVGPDSAGAHPGPACYRKGGPLTITDANLFLGRLMPKYFPKIFGPNENEPLDVQVVTHKFTELTAKINADNRAQGRPAFTPKEVALGFLRVSDEVMARPIRALTEARGFDITEHNLASFGGAGGQHACSVAKALEISRVIIHKYSSILSAYGLALADVVHEVVRPAALEYTPSNQSEIKSTLQNMAAESTKNLRQQGIKSEQIRHEQYLNMRYDGSTTSFMILKSADEHNWEFETLFEERHMREFGFKFPSKKILIDDFRVRGIGSTAMNPGASPYQQLQALSSKKVPDAEPSEIAEVSFAAEGVVETPVYFLDDLVPGTVISGPALILDKTQTIVVVPNSIARVLFSCLIIDLDLHSDTNVATKLAADEVEEQVNPIQLSIFGHRFMSIAEQMGRTLQKTSVSTNMKERLDFSCALFSPDGGLVANAPHVPVHLGSMQFAVKYQHKLWEGKLDDGDVLVSNHPSCGGTHLPDITVITPVFDHGIIVFYVASRGHHADIGGLLPGSMPPNSKRLYQEGAAIKAEKLVSKGVFNEARMTELLLTEPAQHPGCSGTRCLKDNISDLKAQVAANNKGINLIQSLISEYGLRKVHTYMYAIQNTAERAVRELLKETYVKFAGEPLNATDYMDDGTPIVLTVTINNEDGSACFDFTGTGPEVYGNTNAPLAITNSAIIYCLRSLVASDIPLNEGCLAPIKICIPANSLLAPSSSASVVGGNVLTSQRITDVVLKAFGACADSQGCTNNLTFGMGGKDASGSHIEGFGYYETIGGGAGAGPGWDGQDGVHTHMTNTRITDPEVFEKRYPCILHKFGIRPNSGGQGQHPGGNGIIRDIEFRVPVQVSILSERRSRAPNGFAGGENGSLGVNLWIRRDDETNEQRVVNLGGKATAAFSAGDRIVIKTPGGGGWGRV